MGKIQPKNKFIDAIIKVKDSFAQSRNEIEGLKTFYKKKSVTQSLTQSEINYLEHLDKIDQLLISFNEQIKFPSS